MENVTSPDEKLAEFIAFCIEIFKMKRNVSGAEVAELFGVVVLQRGTRWLPPFASGT